MRLRKSGDGVEGGRPGLAGHGNRLVELVDLGDEPMIAERPGQPGGDRFDWRDPPGVGAGWRIAEYAGKHQREPDRALATHQFFKRSIARRRGVLFLHVPEQRW